MLVPERINVSDLKEMEVNRKEINDQEINDLEFDYFNDFENPKNLDKFIKKVEKVIRTSYEYRRFVEAYKAIFTVENCAFFNNIKVSEKTARLELHHYPFTLYDLTSIETKKQSALYTSKVHPFLIAEEVMRLHFNGLVGIVPLSKTVHELAHAGEIFINIKLVKTDYDSYIKKNSNFIEDELLDRVRQIESMSTGDIILGQDSLKRRVTLIENKESALSLELSNPK